MRVIVARWIFECSSETSENTAACSYLRLACHACILSGTRAPESVAIQRCACAAILTWEPWAWISGNSTIRSGSAWWTVAREWSALRISRACAAVLTWIGSARLRYALNATALTVSAASESRRTHANRSEGTFDALCQRMTDSGAAEARGDCTVRTRDNGQSTCSAVAGVSNRTTAALVWSLDGRRDKLNTQTWRLLSVGFGSPSNWCMRPVVQRCIHRCSPHIHWCHCNNVHCRCSLYGNANCMNTSIKSYQN